MPKPIPTEAENAAVDAFRLGYRLPRTKRRDKQMLDDYIRRSTLPKARAKAAGYLCALQDRGEPLNELG